MIAAVPVGRVQSVTEWLWRGIDIAQDHSEYEMAKPILKWAGGKRQLLDEIFRALPKDTRRRAFHEPMVGAGAVFFEVAPKRGSINDINPRLMSFYRVVRDDPQSLIALNRTHRHSKEYYYSARRKLNSELNGTNLDRVEEASLFLFLNRTCFNGLYRENSRGEFNVPFGRYKNPDFIQEKAILAASKVLHGVAIHQGDFDYVEREASKGDVVYFDPPYQPISSTSAFDAYHKGGFDYDEQVRLADTMRRLAKRGILVVTSNSNAREMVELYSNLEGFTIRRVSARRAINCNGEKRGEVGELVVSNVAQSLSGDYF